MVVARSGGAIAAVLVFELNADDGAAILPELPAQLLADLLVESLDFGEVDGIVAARAVLLARTQSGRPPLRASPCAQGPMRGIDVHAVLCAERDEGVEVAATAPVELALDLFVVHPDDVGGDDLDAAGLHLEDLGFPILPGYAGVVELAHDREPGLAIEDEVLRVHGEGLVIGPRAGSESSAHRRGRCGICARVNPNGSLREGESGPKGSERAQKGAREARGRLGQEEGGQHRTTVQNGRDPRIQPK